MKSDQILSSAQPVAPSAMDLSVVEQSPRLRTLYTQLCFCYALDQTISPTSVVAVIKDGLARLTQSFPWIAGQVVLEGKTESNPGTFRVISFEEIPRVVVAHMEEQQPDLSYAELQNARFPFSMLDERTICPRPTLPDDPEQAVLDPAPVFLLQISFIHGGLLLAILASHATMDIAGQVNMINLLSKACHGTPFTQEEINEGNLDRRNIIPLLDEGDQPKSQPPEPKASTAAPQTSASIEDSTSSAERFTWANFSFSSRSLNELKKVVHSSLPTGASFISTDDALCALIWSAVGRARLERLPATTHTNLTRQVDMRRHLGVPQGYTGNMVTQTKSTCTLRELSSKPLGLIAHELRSALQPDDLIYSIRTHATEQALASQRSVKSSRDRSQDVVISSWSKGGCYQVDFNLGLGTPAAVRRPMFTSVEGVVYFLPKAPDGEIVVALCLQSEDMSTLRNDEEFIKYGSYIG